MTSEAVTDADIFAKLREHILPAKLTQLLVDITNKSMEDDTFRNSVIERLEVVLESPVDTSPRLYDISLGNMRKVYSSVNPNAIDVILKYAPQYGINTKKQMAAFIATCLLESQGFNAKREGFNYSAKRLIQVFPKFRIPDIDFARDLIAQGQVAMANHLYNGRFGNRLGTNDGWNYRGGGLIQNTFRSNYYELQHMTGIAFGDNPKLIEDLDNSVRAAMAFWQIKGCNDMAEQINTYANGYTLNTLTASGVETGDYELNYGARVIRKTVNGGLNGYTDFCQLLENSLRHL